MERKDCQMKDMIVSALKSKVGLSDEQAGKAADVVMDVVQSKGGDLLKGVPGLGAAGGALGGLPGGLGGMLGGDKK
jgi:hypothetical protein